MTVTIFNRTEENADGEMQYKASVFRNVRIETKLAANPVDSGERNNDNFILFLFSKEGYVTPEHFVGENRKGHWTLAPGDLVAEGICTALPARPYRINTVNPCYAGEHFHHWEVKGRGQILE